MKPSPAYTVIRTAGVLLTILLIVLGPGSSLAETEGKDPYLDFAHHLFQEGDFYRAVTEAKRFLFLHPNHPRKLEAEILIARALKEAGQYDEAREAYGPVAVQKERPDLSVQAYSEVGKCLEKTDPQGNAVKYYQALPDDPNLPPQCSEDMGNTSRYRLGWLHLEGGRWLEAKAEFDRVEAGHPLKESASALSYAALTGKDLPYRSPAVAGFMSALLPGSGQLYVGRPTDAALAFILNAAFIYGAYEAYENENWPVFGLLGVFELGWYGGNIYNAVNGAHYYNREAREEYLRRLRRDHGWRLNYCPKVEGVELSYTVNY